MFEFYNTHRDLATYFFSTVIGMTITFAAYNYYNENSKDKDYKIVTIGRELTNNGTIIDTANNVCWEINRTYQSNNKPPNYLKNTNSNFVYSIEFHIKQENCKEKKPTKKELEELIYELNEFYFPKQF